jgi:hypothetical protein
MKTKKARVIAEELGFNPVVLLQRSRVHPWECDMGLYKNGMR